MSESIQYRFGPCLVLPERREVFLDGKLRAISPKTFDVLVYLIEQRHRVVKREELIKEIWKGRVVVDNVVARTIMQIREAIGDPSADPQMIRTVQRVGYRFVAALDQTSAPAPADVGVKGGERAAFSESLRLGFLPFVNLTGDPQLAWIELGLLSLVVQSLNTGPRLSVLSTASVLMCTENLGAALTAEERATTLMRMLGVQVVIGASITKSGQQFVLSYRSFGSAIEEFQGELSGPELTQLGLQLAHEVEHRLFPNSSQGISPQSDDHFVNECFSRGMQASDARQWHAASKFFEIIRLLDPSSISMRIQYAYVQARLPHPDAVEQARSLVEEAKKLGDPVLESRAQYVLALALAESEVEIELARQTVDHALMIAPPNLGEEWRTRAYLLKVYLAFIQHDYGACEEAIAEAYRICQAEGNRVWLVPVLNNRAAVQSVLGEPQAAYETTKEVLALCEGLGDQMKPIAMGNHAYLAFALGLFDECLTTCDAFVQLVVGLKDRPFTALGRAISALYFGASELRETHRMLTWKNQLATRHGSPENAITRAFELYCDALIDQSKGELASACRLLSEARGLFEQGEGYHELAAFVPHLIVNLLRLGRDEEASAERRLIASFEAFSNDTMIRPAMHYLDALRTWQSGEDESAFAQLKEGLQVSMPSLWQAYMRFDLAWLYLQRQDVKKAEEILSPVEPWLARHPAGLAVAAMLAYRQGRFATALERHARHLEIVGGDHLTRFKGIEKFYRSKKSGRPDEAVDQRLLPSIYWARR